MQDFLKRDYFKINKPYTHARQKRRKNLALPNIQFALFGVVLLLLFIAKIPGIVPTDIITTLFNVIMYAIIAVGFCMLLGYAGLASLGTAGFVGIGIYSAYFVMERWGLTFGIALVFAILIAIGIGITVGFISLRIEGIYLAIITLGVSEILAFAFKALASSLSLSAANRKLFFIKLGITNMQGGIFIIGVLILVALLVMSSNLINSPTGRAMIAMKNSTAAAQAMGISLMKYRLLAFVISVIYAAIAGVIYFLYIGSFQATDLMLTITTSLNILGAVIIGGATSLWGAVFGVFIIYGLNTILMSYVPFFRQNGDMMTIIIGLLIVIIVMFYAGGFNQLINSIRFRIEAKKSLGRLLTNDK